MKILITGATGMIGTELVALLLDNNYSVNYLTTSKKKLINTPNYNGFYWNPQEGKIDDKCLDGVAVIVHLAGASIAKRWTNSYKQELIESRVLSSNLLFNLVKKTPNSVQQIVSASGTALYPDSNEVVYDEYSTQIENSFLSNVVVKWEESIDQFKLLNIRVAKLRTGVVYSEKGGALLEIIKPIKMGFGSAFGTGKQLQSWIHLTDVCNLYYFVIKNKYEGIFNAVSPNPISNQNLTKLIAKILHKPLFLPKIPQFLMKLILGEMHILLFNDKNIIPKRALDLNFQFKYPTAEKAIQNILK